jgi:hypothetical protein
MNTLEDNITRFVRAVEGVKDAPPNQETQEIKKKLSDIRDLMIKADVAMDTGRNPSYLFDRIEQILDNIDNINQK